MIRMKFSQQKNTSLKMKKRMVGIMIMAVLFILLGCNMNPSEDSFGNSPSSSDISLLNEERPVDENGKPLPYYLDESNKSHYFKLPKDIQLCSVINKDAYQSIFNRIRDLNQYERIEDTKYRNKDVFDLSVHTLLSAMGEVALSSQEDTTRWNAEYPLTQTYAGPGSGYIPQASLNRFMDSIYTNSRKNITLNSLQYYYCAPIKQYVVPVEGQYTSQLPVLRNISVDGNLIKAEFSFLYYVYYDTPEEGENTICDFKGNDVGQFVNGEAVVDQSKLAQLDSYEFVFQNDADVLRLDSIKLLSNHQGKSQEMICLHETTPSKRI